MFLTFCCLCGGPPENNPDSTKYKWLKTIGAVLPSDKYAFGDYNENGDIEMSTYIVNVDPVSYDSAMGNVKKGFLVHKACYHLADNVKNLYAKLSSFTRIRNKSGYLSGLNYSPLSKYVGQLFNWDKFDNNPNDHYALQCPLYSSKNKKRIMDNIKKVDKKTVKSSLSGPVGPTGSIDYAKLRANKKKKGYSFSRKTGKWVKIKRRSVSKRRSRSRSTSRKRSRSRSTSPRRRRRSVNKR